MNQTPSRTRRRAATSLLASTTMLLAGVVIAPQAGATATVTSERLAGTNRYLTAGAIAKSSTMGTPIGAIVTTAQNFPDALAASVLAGANGPQPILLTEQGRYLPDTKDALAALKAKTPNLSVTIVGGTGAVGQSVEDAIKADGFTVTRIAGTDRYDTASLIARAAALRQPSGTVGGAKTALFATGENYPDALAAGVIAFRTHLPILLVTANTMPESTRQAIQALGIKNAVIVGGTTAISAQVATQIAVNTGDTTVERLAGANRYATAGLIADYESTTLAYPMATVTLATGVNFPDALAAGPLAGIAGGPIIPVAAAAASTGLPAESRQTIDKYRTTISKLLVAGGTTAVADRDVAEANVVAQRA